MDKHLDDLNIFHYNVTIKIHASSQNKKEKLYRVKTGSFSSKYEINHPAFIKRNDTKGVYIKNIYYCGLIKVSLVAQLVKHLPTMRETRVRSLGREDPLEKEMATHSSTLAWEIPWMEELDKLQSMGLQRVGHN